VGTPERYPDRVNCGGLLEGSRGNRRAGRDPLHRRSRQRRGGVEDVVALVRPPPDAFFVDSAEEVSAARHGQFIRAAGIVTCRQRPATASGVIFVTLEDETGYVNLVVWNDLAERQRRELLGSRLLAVQGEVQRQGSVVHVLARRLEDLSPMLGRLATSSHDFH